MMMVLLFGTFILILITTEWVRRGSQKDVSDWKASIVITTVFWGVVVVVISELLSSLHLLNRTNLLVAWIVIIMLFLVIATKRGVFRKSELQKLFTNQVDSSRSYSDRALTLGLLAIIAVLFLIAIIAPPNTTDSLLYHMPRVVKWEQNSSLEHYATAYEHQLWSPIWAELVILNFRLLTAGDQFANLVQWFSMAISLVGVAAIAQLLGASKRAQLLSVMFAVSIPMGILQATSTQTDYVVTLWLVSLLFLVTLSKRRILQIHELLAIPVTIGLGGLTKATFYPYAAPILIWYFLPRISIQMIRKTILEIALLVGVVTAINYGFFTRNIRSFGHPFGAEEWVRSKSSLSIDPQVWVVNFVQHVALNFVSPVEALNKNVDHLLGDMRVRLGVNQGDFSRIWLWNHEDLAGNPLHFILALFSIIVLVKLTLRSQSNIAAKYATTILFSFIFFGFFISVYPYAVRHHLSFLVIWAPTIGWTAQRTWSGRLTPYLSLILIVTSLPWLFLNRSRPLLGMKPRTMSESILIEDPNVILFANWTNLRKPYEAATEAIKSLQCSDIGLVIDSHDLEYPFWWLLEAPKSGYRIEAIETYPHLEMYLDDDFFPCAILCTICDGLSQKEGLQLFDRYGNISLFIDPSLNFR